MGHFSNFMTQKPVCGKLAPITENAFHKKVLDIIFTSENVGNQET
jgi:hypothetical protein